MPRFRTMSIRLRFTLIYSLILAVMLMIFSFGLFFILGKTTFDALTHDLTKSSDMISAVIEENGGELLPANVTALPPIPKPFADFDDTHELGKLPEREMVRILDAQGNLLASPRGFNSEILPISKSAFINIALFKDVYERVTIDNNEYLVLDHPLVIDDQLMYIIQVARPLTEQSRSLRFLGLALLVGSMFTVLLAMAVGWWFSGVTLAPIQKITQTAQAIGDEKDFSQRVEYNGPRDEVGSLAHTFNGMLEKLQASYKQVEHSLEMQREFVADVSHELRTPLTTLSGNIGLLRRHPPLPKEEQADILTDVNEEADRMIRLVNDLLVLARADAGRHLNIAAFDPSLIIEETARQARILAPERGISTHLEQGLQALGDKDAVKQAVLIGLDNAIKHSAGDIKVAAVKRGNLIEISVQDSGEGIAPERLAHIFDRFYRGDDSTIPGFGLGLPIARSLMQGMGGDISMRSDPGEGSQLLITLQAA